LRNSRPSIAWSIGRMIVLSIPKRPEPSPAKKADAASAHSSAVMTILLSFEWQTPGRRIHSLSRYESSLALCSNERITHLGDVWDSQERTSQNAVHAKFAEFTFHALR
jgi:hypothetical protein